MFLAEPNYIFRMRNTILFTKCRTSFINVSRSEVPCKPPRSSPHEMTDTISSILIECLRRLNDVAARKEWAHLDAKLHQVLWNDELGRLRIWAANIGAHQSGQSSLDYRLRDASHIRNQTIKLLQRLRRVIRDIEDLLSSTTSHDAYRGVDDVDYRADDPDADRDDATDEDDTELQQIYHALVDTINCLFQISMVIRRPTQHDRLIGTQKLDVIPFEPFDRALVAHRYPDIEQVLIDRLGSAISRRRAALKYRQRHHAKLGKGVDRAVDDQKDTVSTRLSDTLATNSEESRIDSDTHSDAGTSETSYASSLLKDNEEMTIPAAPTCSADNQPFECPYCFYIITVQNKGAWIRHVFQDLMPYVCVFPDCPLPNRLYDSRHEWHRHLQSAHASNLARGEDTECPLRCGTTVLDSLLVRHLGQHLEDLALFALPRGDSDDEKTTDRFQGTNGNDDSQASPGERETRGHKDQASLQPVDTGANDADTTDALQRLQAVHHVFRQTWLPLCERFLRETRGPSTAEQRLTKISRLFQGIHTNVVSELMEIDVNTREELVSRHGLLVEVRDILGVIDEAGKHDSAFRRTAHGLTRPSESSNEEDPSKGASNKEQTEQDDPVEVHSVPAADHTRKHLQPHNQAAPKAATGAVNVGKAAAAAFGHAAGGMMAIDQIQQYNQRMRMRQAEQYPGMGMQEQLPSGVTDAIPDAIKKPPVVNMAGPGSQHADNAPSQLSESPNQVDPSHAGTTNNSRPLGQPGPLQQQKMKMKMKKSTELDVLPSESRRFIESFPHDNAGNTTTTAKGYTWDCCNCWYRDNLDTHCASCHVRRCSRCRVTKVK
ncbi:hypothetical protein PV11_07011 [Exophiala sideris]|uniref:Oxidoreductase acuF-like C2H2 type zinc-finger domain-containing protein n=1 Tax=Exophiala sideris TaxID=1016849 RepID=A0A0D1YF38_9EURO|nr:hypothetical protein PV11_07011 [Exophiala sideris]